MSRAGEDSACLSLPQSYYSRLIYREVFFVSGAKRKSQKIRVGERRYLMRFSTNLVPLRLEPSESASLGDSYHVRRVRLNLMTLSRESMS